MGKNLFGANTSDEDLLRSVLAKVPHPPQHPEAPPVETEADTTPACQMPGFVEGTRIATTFGLVPVELLRVPDPLMTLGGGARRVRRIDKVRLDAALLARNPEAQPVQIRVNALSPGLPERDLLVSPGQPIVVASAGSPRHCMTAGEMRGRADIAAAPQNSVTYFLLELDQPDTIYAERVPVFIAPRPAEEEEDETD